MKDVQSKGIVGAAKKEANRLGVMPKGSTMKALGQMKTVVQDANRAAMAMGMGSQKLDQALTAVDSAGAKLQKVNQASKAIARGDPAAIASAARSGMQMYKGRKK